MRYPRYRLFLSLTLLVGCSAPALDTPAGSSGTAPVQPNNILLQSGAKPIENANGLLKPVENNILQQSGIQTGLESTQVKGQILLQSGILQQSGILLQSGATPASGILLQSGFVLQQTRPTVPGAGFLVKATDPSGKTYGPVTADSSGQYSLGRILSGLRLSIQASAPQNKHLTLQAMVDTSKTQETPADINTRSTAQALLVTAEAQRTNQPATAIALNRVQNVALVQQVEDKIVQVLTTQPLTQPLSEIPAVKAVVQQVMVSLPPPSLVLPVNPLPEPEPRGPEVPGIAVALMRPSKGMSLTVGSPLTLEALTASLAVALMEFYDGFEKIGSVSREPYRLVWQTTGKATGKHTIQAVAKDSKGNRLGESVVVDVELVAAGTSSSGGSSVPAPVAAPAPPPVVVLTVSSLGIANGIIGSSLTINGTGFDGVTMANNVVKFGTTTATVTGSTATTVTATVPGGISGTQNVTVTVGAQTNTGTNNFAVTPTISSLSTSSGIIGSSLTINGTGFDNVTMGNNVVKFGTTTATVTGSTATTVTATVPTISGTQNVTVTLGAQTNSGTNNYAVTPTISSLGTTSGSIGSSLTINGTGFDGVTMANNAVKFGTTTATVTASTATTVTATVPGGINGYENVTVTIGAQTNAGTNFFSLYTVTTLAGGTAGFSDGPVATARFNNPHRLAGDSAGNLFIAVQSNQRVRKLDTAGIVTTYAGHSDGVAGFTDGAASAARFSNPRDVVLDSAGNLYVMDTSGQRVRKINTLGIVSTFAGDGTIGSNNGIGTAARFNTANGLAMDSSGNIFVADSLNNSVRKITSAGTVSNVTGGFNTPVDVAVDSAGNIYVADNGNHRIAKINTAAVVSTFAGALGVSGFSNGVATAARFTNPGAVTLDSAGNIYVTDQFTHSLRKIDTAGNVTVIAGNGTSGFSDGLAANVKFNTPTGVLIDSSGSIYVADTFNHRIRKITPVP